MSLQRLSTDVLGRVLTRLDRTGALAAVRLWPAWRGLMGPEISAMARPLGRRKAVLVLGVEDPVAMQELAFMTEEILAKVNTFLGEKIFDKVSLELLNGRAPLDELRPMGRVAKPAPAAPRGLGGLSLPPESPVRCCYETYVRLFEKGRNARNPGGR